MSGVNFAGFSILFRNKKEKRWFDKRTDEIEKQIHFKFFKEGRQQPRRFSIIRGKRRSSQKVAGRGKCQVDNFFVPNQIEVILQVKSTIMTDGIILSE